MHYAFEKLEAYQKAKIDHQVVFLVGRDLCCCTDSSSSPPPAPYVTYEKYFHDEKGIESYEGPATEEALRDLRRTDINLKELLYNSIGSPHRYDNGAVPFTSSDTFLITANSLLWALKVPETETLLSNSAIVPPVERDRLIEVYGDISVGEAMNKGVEDLSLILGKTTSDTLALKSTVVQAANPGFTPPTGINQPRKVISVAISTSYPDPSSPRQLAAMSDPADPIVVEAAAVPDTIDVTFNAAPDSGTLSPQTMLLIQGAQAITGTVLSPNPSTGRFTASQPLAPGMYGVRVLGDGPHTVQFNGAPLDGEPISLPTGTGVAGGDFYFTINVV